MYTAGRHQQITTLAIVVAKHYCNGIRGTITVIANMPTFSRQYWPVNITISIRGECSWGAGVQGWAEQAGKHVEEVATFRAGGLPASVRTIAHCGFAGTVAYSLTGLLANPTSFPFLSWFTQVCLFCVYVC